MTDRGGVGETVGATGEFATVAAITARFAQGARVRLGPGDDAAAVEVGAGVVVASVDLLVQDRHFRLDWSSALDIGHKAAAVSLSDINAMGGTASALLVGFGCPAETETAWVRDLAAGLAAESTLVDASVVGGDLTAAGTLVLSVTAFGECANGVVTRAGARPGDVLALAGRQGLAGAGFAVLSRGFRSPRSVVDAHRRPAPPYAAGPQAASLGATSMVDISDGLLQDVGHLATASGVAIDVESSRLDVGEPLQAVGAALGVDPIRFVLTGGDDYGLAATFPPDVDLPSEWRAIGRVLDGGDPGAVTVDGAADPDPGGHRHFS